MRALPLQASLATKHRSLVAGKAADYPILRFQWGLSRMLPTAPETAPLARLAVSGHAWPPPGSQQSVLIGVARKKALWNGGPGLASKFPGRGRTACCRVRCWVQMRGPTRACGLGIISGKENFRTHVTFLSRDLRPTNSDARIGIIESPQSGVQSGDERSASTPHRADPVLGPRKKTRVPTLYGGVVRCGRCWPSGRRKRMATRVPRLVRCSLAETWNRNRQAWLPRRQGEMSPSLFGSS